MSLLIAFNCDKNSTGYSVNGLRFVDLNNSIEITNNNPSTIHFLIVERKTTAIIDWSPGCNLDDPNQIKASHTKSILYEDITGYEKDCEIVIYWWFCIKKIGEDQLTPDNFQSTVIKTK